MNNIITPENQVVLKANLEAVAKKVAVADAVLLVEELVKDLPLFQLDPTVVTVLSSVLNEVVKHLTPSA